MGNVTTINFYNDAYGDIKNHPEEVIENILNAMENTSENMKTYSIGNFANPMTASRSEHSDNPRLYITFCNSFVELGRRNDASNSMLNVRKDFLNVAKRIIKEEENEIKKIEGKMKVDYFDFLFIPPTSKQFGKYMVFREDTTENYLVYENSIQVLKGKWKEVADFINKQVIIRPVKKK